MAGYSIITFKARGGQDNALYLRNQLVKLGAYDISVRAAGTGPSGQMTGYQSNSLNSFDDSKSAKSRAESIFKKTVSEISGAGPVVGTLRLKTVGHNE